MSWFLKRALPAGIVALSAVVAGAPKADAFGWHHGAGGSSGGSSGYGGWGSSGGSSGGYDAAYGSSGGSSGYSYGSSGGSSGHQRVGFLARLHNVFHHHRGHGSSGGSSGYSHGSSGGSSGYSGHGSSGGSSGYHGGSGGSAGAAYYGGANYGGAYYGGYGMYNGMPVVGAGAPADAAVLTVSVPADAKVFVNGYETTSVGTEMLGSTERTSMFSSISSNRLTAPGLADAISLARKSSRAWLLTWSAGKKAAPMRPVPQYFSTIARVAARSSIVGMHG